MSRQSTDQTENNNVLQPVSLTSLTPEVLGMITGCLSFKKNIMLSRVCKHFRSPMLDIKAGILSLVGETCTGICKLEDIRKTTVDYRRREERGIIETAVRPDDITQDRWDALNHFTCSYVDFCVFNNMDEPLSLDTARVFANKKNECMLRVEQFAEYNQLVCVQLQPNGTIILGYFGYIPTHPDFVVRDPTTLVCCTWSETDLRICCNGRVEDLLKNKKDFPRFFPLNDLFPGVSYKDFCDALYLMNYIKSVVSDWTTSGLRVAPTHDTLLQLQRDVFDRVSMQLERLQRLSSTLEMCRMHGSVYILLWKLYTAGMHTNYIPQQWVDAVLFEAPNLARLIENFHGWYPRMEHVHMYQALRDKNPDDDVYTYQELRNYMDMYRMLQD